MSHYVVIDDELTIQYTLINKNTVLISKGNHNECWTCLDYDHQIWHRVNPFFSRPYAIYPTTVKHIVDGLMHNKYYSAEQNQELNEILDKLRGNKRA